MQCLGKTELEEGEECYFTSRTLYQLMKYSYMRNQIIMRPCGATSYRTYNSYHLSSISLSQHNQTEQRTNA